MVGSAVKGTFALDFLHMPVAGSDRFIAETLPGPFDRFYLREIDVFGLERDAIAITNQNTPPR
jgi:hypothetical protein